MSTVLVMALLCACNSGGNSKELETKGNEITYVTDSPAEESASDSDLIAYYKESVVIGEFRFDDYSTYTNIVIPIENNGEKDIAALTIWYQFLDANGEMLSQELNICFDLLAGSNKEIESSYGLSDVATVRINSVDMELSDGSYMEYDLESPVDYSVSTNNECPSVSNDNNNNDASITQTEQFYNVATTLTKFDLTKNSLGQYVYLNLPFSDDECAWIDNPLNVGHKVHPGALYRKMAMCLEAFSIGNNWKSYASYIIGFVPENRSDFEPYAENLKRFITTEDNPMESVLKEFEAISVVSGSFDYENGSYDFEISDLTVCAEEMQVSEEMLGYILAMTTEYAAEISFDANSCTVHYFDYRNQNN